MKKKQRDRDADHEKICVKEIKFPTTNYDALVNALRKDNDRLVKDIELSKNETMVFKKSCIENDYEIGVLKGFLKRAERERAAWKGQCTKLKKRIAKYEGGK